MRTKNTRLAAVVIFVAGLALTLFALSNPSSMFGSGMMGGTNGYDSYSFADVLLVMVGSFLMARGALLAILTKDYEPLTDIPQLRHPGHTTATPAIETGPEAVKAPEPAVEAVVPSSSCPSVDERILVMRLLSGDERAMFRVIVESGGEALQKDLIIKTKMSDAKVSRTLDRLVEKGVISKTRHGITNKVKIEIEH